MSTRFARALSFAAVGGVVIGLVSCGGEDALKVGSVENAIAVCPSGATILGVDVSAYQGAVNWGAVHAAGRDFAIAKATEGTGVQDSTFGANWSGIKAAGMIRGAYHFFHPSISGSSQADYFVNYVNAHGGFQNGDIPPMLDWEVTDGVSNATDISQAQAFIARVQALTGRTTLIYTYPSFWNCLGNPNFNAYPFNIANYGVSCPNLPSPWTSWKIWQYSSSGSVSGIGGPVDEDKFNGDLAAMQAWTSTIPPYDGQWVSQSYPSDMYSGDTAAASLTYKNTGSKTWDTTNTRVGTTVPRDRASAFADSSWINPARPTAVSASTAPGATGHFNFVLHAPDVVATTTFVEHWGLVQEGVTWFGPPDPAVWFQITVHPRAQSDLPPGPTQPAGASPFAGQQTGGCDAAPGSPVGAAGAALVLILLLGTLALGRRWPVRRARCTR